MPSLAVDNAPRMNARAFIAFYNSRSDEEKWELIDGVPIMIPPPTLTHQRIARNLQQLLNARLVQIKPEWSAEQEIGILVPDDDSYNPEPDVAVIDTLIEPGQIYAENFYLVAEILSQSDTDDLITAKLAFYKSHPGNSCILLVSQEEVRITLHERRPQSEWTERILTGQNEELVISELGLVCTVSQIYQNTHLAP